MSRQSGWGAVGQGLGTLFGGGQERDALVYRERLGQNATLAEKMAVADRARIQTMALEGLMRDGSLSQQDRNILAAQLGNQFAGLQQGRQREQEVGLRGEAFARADAAGYGVNAPLFGITRGPVAVNNALAGGRRMGDAFMPGAELAVTDYGEADIGRIMAQTEANEARTRASHAAAALSDARRTRPEDFRAPPRNAAPSVATPADILTIRTINDNERRLARAEGRQPNLLPEPELGMPMGPAPERMVNPETGQIIEFRNGEWVVVGSVNE